MAAPDQKTSRAHWESPQTSTHLTPTFPLGRSMWRTLEELPSNSFSQPVKRQAAGTNKVKMPQKKGPPLCLRGFPENGEGKPKGDSPPPSAPLVYDRFGPWFIDTDEANLRDVVSLCSGCVIRNSRKSRQPYLPRLFSLGQTPKHRCGPDMGSNRSGASDSDESMSRFLESCAVGSTTSQPGFLKRPALSQVALVTSTWGARFFLLFQREADQSATTNLTSRPFLFQICLDRSRGRPPNSLRGPPKVEPDDIGWPSIRKTEAVSAPPLRV